MALSAKAVLSIIAAVALGTSLVRILVPTSTELGQGPSAFSMQIGLLLISISISMGCYIGNRFPLRLNPVSMSRMVAGAIFGLSLAALPIIFAINAAVSGSIVNGAGRGRGVSLYSAVASPGGYWATFFVYCLACVGLSYVGWVLIRRVLIKRSA